MFETNISEVRIIKITPVFILQIISNKEFKNEEPKSMEGNIHIEFRIRIEKIIHSKIDNRTAL